MREYITKPNYVCALGAFTTALAIDGVVPILHAGPGCGAKLDGGIGTYNGCQGSGFVAPHILPSTNIGQKEAVFGGGELLAETIEQAIKAYKGELFTVFTGCVSEIVGDDVREVVSRFENADKPVILAETGGFKGNNLFGHEVFWNSVIDGYLKPAAVNSNLVNVFASVPFQNPFWFGDLKEIGRLLNKQGLEVNLIYGPSDGFSLDKIPSARFNLLISPWAGLKNVQKLEEKFGTPYLHFNYLPIGPTETAEFLRQTAEFAGIDGGAAQRIIDEENREYYYLIERASDELVKTRLLPSRFITVADALYAAGITRFLVNDIGLIPQIQYITDNPPPEFHDEITEVINDLDDGIKTPVVFVSGSGEAHDDILSRNFDDKAFIIGSGWEKSFAAEYSTKTLAVSAPLLDRMVLNRTYAGYTGALTLIEDICTPILGAYQ